MGQDVLDIQYDMDMCACNLKLTQDYVATSIQHRKWSRKPDNLDIIFFIHPFYYFLQ